VSFDDVQLNDAVDYLWQHYCENLPDVSDYHPAFSKRFLKKMERLCRRYRFQIRAPMFAQVVAAVILMTVIVGGVCIAVSPNARAIIQKWIIEVYEDTFIYHFFEDSPKEEWNNYEITMLPQGYVNIYVEQTAAVCTKLYQYKEDILVFTYHRLDTSIVHAVKDEQRIPTKVKDFAAAFYSSTDGTANTLIWIDETTHMVFSVSGFFEQKTLVKIAESVQVIK